MGAKTKIEWTRGADGTAGATWTPIRARNKATGKVGWHCEHASPGCLHCYSEALNRDRLGTRLAFKPGHRADVETFLDETMLTQPLRWARPRMIFVCSMTDLFGEFVPDAMIDRMFAVMALASQHTLQVLTKRSARMRAYCSDPATPDRIDRAMDEIAPAHWHTREIEDFGGWPLSNVWCGVSCEDQRRADERVPDLLATPAAVRFVSAEPLLSGIDLRWALAGPVQIASGFLARGQFAPGLETLRRLDWVIAGGESGPNARPMHPVWARSIRDQCAAAGVAFHFKQWGEWAAADDWPSEIQEDYDVRGLTKGACIRVGKARAGRLLDGIEHNGVPEVRA